MAFQYSVPNIRDGECESLINNNYKHRIWEKLTGNKLLLSWSWWPRGLRYGTAAARLLGLRVRIPPGTWMFVSCECCVRQVDHLSWGVLLSVIEKHLKGGLGPLGLTTHEKTVTWIDIPQARSSSELFWRRCWTSGSVKWEEGEVSD